MTQQIALSPLQQTYVELKNKETRLSQLLPKTCTPDRFIQIVGNALIKNSYLLKLDKISLIDSCLKCAEDGLLPDGREAALVPMGNKVQYMPMVAGILKKIRNSGELLSISANVVYRGDDFDYCLGDDEKIIHKPNLDVEPTMDNILFVYAIAKTKNGGIYRSVMTKNQINAVRNKSQAHIAFTAKKVKTSIWNDHWEEMAKKTVIHRVSKRLPMSTDLVNIINSDEMQMDTPTINKSNIFDSYKENSINSEIITESIEVDDDCDVSPEIIAQAEKLATEREATNG